MTDREGPIHRSIVAYLRGVLPADALIHHSPNEGVRGGAAGARDGRRRKAMGQMPGWPDIELFTHGQVIMLEVKAEGGRLSPAQRVIRDRFEAIDVPYYVVRSIQDVDDVLAALGIEHRGGGKAKTPSH